MQQCAIGVDLGGTKIEVAIVNMQGEVINRLRVPSDISRGPDAVIQDITDTVRQLCNQQPNIMPSSIGVGVAGQIEKNTGIVTYAPNLEWRNVKLQEELNKRLGKPVIVCNDVKAAMWGEWKYGSGKGCDELVCIFVGTGIGSGIISRGYPLEGRNNTAGEIGHTTVLLNGPLCHCGNKGCLEALAGGWAMERDAREAVRQDENAGKTLLHLANGDVDAITGKTITEAIIQNDALAIKIMDNVTDALIAGVTSVVNMLGPCRIILGGGVIEGMPLLIERIEKGVKKFALKAATKNLKILPAKLHNDSGVVGAAALALHQSI